MDTSQQRLFAYIQINKAVTVNELAKVLGMTPANARHHLSALLKAGLVVATGERSQRQRGRPAAIYRISEQALGHNLDKLLIAWLEEFVFPLPESAQQALLRRLARKMASEMQPTPLNKPPDERTKLSRRLSETIQSLDALHYQARWEAHADAPRVILGHCPYIAIQQKYPQICLFDNYLLETLLAKNVCQIACMAVDLRGAYHCTFRIENVSSQ